MDDVLVQDRSVPTRGNNVLDIKLVNNNAYENIVKHKVLARFDSDHNPTTIDINLNSNPNYGNKAMSIKNSDCRYTIMDLKRTQKKLRQAILRINGKNVTLNTINEIQREAVTYKTMKQRPVKFWTPQLRKAVRLQNEPGEQSEELGCKNRIQQPLR